MEIINSGLNWVATNWEVFGVIAGLIGISGVESFIMAFVTKYWGENKTKLFKMYSVYFFMFVTTALTYLATTPDLPPYLIPLVGAAKFVISQSWYTKLWSPLITKLYSNLADFQAYKQQGTVEPVTEGAIDFSH